MIKDVAPLDSSRINDPQYWRERALETHDHANGLTNPLAREAMAYVAVRYNHVAEKIEKHLDDCCPRPGSYCE
jgi:hypothetical protein